MKKALSVFLAAAMLASVFAFFATAEDRVFSVDFVTASWTVDGAEVTATVEGKDLQAGPVDLREFDAIRLNGFDGGRMIARVTAEDGFSAVLEPNGDNEVSLGRPVDPDVNLPGTLRFEVVKREGAGPGEEPGGLGEEPVGPGEEPGGPGEEPVGPGEEPGDRKFTVDFGTASWTVNGVHLWVVMWGMDRMDGVLEIEEHDLIRVDGGFDPATMQVRVFAEDGFSALLVPNENNEVSLFDLADPTAHLPDTLRFVVEARPGEEPGEVQGFILALKNEEIRDYHTHVVDFLQMTPEEIGITPEEYEAVKKQIGGELSQYDKWISLYQLRAEKDGQEFGEEPCSVAIDMTDAMLGFEDFKLIGVNDEDMSLLDFFVLEQKDGKLIGDLPRLGVYALVGDEVQEDLLPGDVDGDGKISSADARLALRISVGLETEMVKGTRAYDAADVTERDKGEVTPADARLILRRSVGFNDPEYGV